MASDLISRSVLLKAMDNVEELMEEAMCIPSWATAKKCIRIVKPVDAVEVVHGEWVLEAHNEKVNYRWNVTAKCSNCGKDKGEIWAGFFPDFPAELAERIAIMSAETIKLSNYCPNCGAKMDGGDKE